jgi:dTDP-glucose 4,6-dehydratase
MKVLITGGAGFIGHHLVEHLLRETDWTLTLLDRLDHSGNLNRLTSLACWHQEQRRVRFVFHDLRAPINSQLARQIGPQDYVFHLAAATHVDRSITDPMGFVFDNVVATGHLLEHVRSVGCSQYVQFSTDEVFGPAAPGTSYDEWARYRSGNPYAATKAGAEELCLAYQNTYRLPISIIHCMNVFGERQHPEKFIPMVIGNVLAGEVVPIHANATKTQAGSRFYIHARNVSAALLWLVPRFVPGEKYNIVGEREVDNLTLAQMIAQTLERPLRYDLVDFHSSRPGHDLRYALDGTRLETMGWRVPKSFESSLGATVRWTATHPEWLPAAGVPA